MANLTVIADDLTGALDTGVQFANSHASVRVATVQNTSDIRDDIFDCDVAVLDAEVRHRPPQEAYEHCIAVVRAALQNGSRVIYIKTDSGLRGNIGAMFQAALDGTGTTFAAYAPALPRMGRITRNGVAYIDGIPINKTAFGQDPFEPVRSPYVRDLFADYRLAVRNYPVGGRWDTSSFSEPTVGIFDICNNGDFQNLAMHLQRTGQMHVLGGCAGFAAILPQYLGLSGPLAALPDINAPLLVLCGSLNPITKRQLEYGEQRGGIRVGLQDEQLRPGYFDSEAGQAFLDLVDGYMASGRDILIDTGGSAKAETAEEADQLRGIIANQLGALMVQMLERPQAVHYLPMIIGGDTLMGFMQQLPQAEISPIGEVAPGAVLFSAILESKDSRVLVSKSGGFGSEDLLDRIHSNLQKGHCA